MSENDRLDQGLDELAVLGAEAGEGLEVQSEVVVWVALGGIEDEHVRAHGESESDPLERIEAGLGAARLVAAQLDHVHAGPIGESLLR